MKKKYIIFLLFILILAFFLRIYNLGANDLWFDEASSYNCAYSSNFYDKYSIHPSFYFRFLGLLLNFFKSTAFNMRLLSVAFGILTVFITFFLTRILFNSKAGIIAAFLTAFSPLQIWYSQEVKMYTTLSFFTVLTFYFLVKSVNSKRIFWYIFFIFSFGICFITHFYSFFLILPVFLFLLFNRYKISYFYSKILILTISIGAFLWIYIERFFSNFNFVTKRYWIEVPQLKDILYTLENFNLGYTSGNIWYKVSIASVSAIFIYIIFNINRYRYKDVFRNYLLLCFLLIIIIVQVFLFSIFFVSIYLDRCLLYITPFYYIVIGAGLMMIKGKAVRNLIFVILILGMFVSLYNYYNGDINPNYQHHFGTYIKRPVSPAVQFVKSEFDNDKDIIIYTHPSLIPLFFYYWGGYESYEKGEYPWGYFLMFSNEVDDYWRQQIKNRDFYFYIDIRKNSFQDKCKFRRALWVISSNWSRNGEIDNNSKAVLEYLEDNYRKVFGKNFKGIWVTVFVKEHTKYKGVLDQVFK